MRFLILMFSFFIWDIGAKAVNSNPMMRICRIEVGQFWVLQGQGDDMPLCMFGSAGVGAEALYLYHTNQGATQSLRAYFQNFGVGCEGRGAERISGQDSDGRVFQLCRFPDQSLIEEITLQLGPGAPENTALDKALADPTLN